ncbi:SDR family NAD(P)-dependent oxidoreductase [Algoriphagus boritolerans]|uniref:SDR family NAD(P)-dependent oxidoreductase n=1 Tax=Algoriphagus boritolerans TaxID=308111 RepID=UPI002FCE6148
MNSKKVILPVRNRDKAKKMIEGLPDKNKIHLVSVDLSEMKSVVTGANEILGLADQIDVLINNAGGMYPAKKTDF